MRWGALALTLALSGCVANVFAPFGPRPLGYSFDSGGLEQAETELRIDFGRAQDGAIASASRLFGTLPDEVVEQRDCGAGVVQSARWPGVSLNFRNGALRGWVLAAPGLPAEGLSVGMDRDALPDVTLRPTSLGTEFEYRGVFGVILPGETEVAQLWSGVTCFYR